MTDRWDKLRQYRFQLPPLDTANLALLTKWLLIAVLAGGALWLVRRAGARLMPGNRHARLSGFGKEA
jgi:hypothetical protein